MARKKVATRRKSTKKPVRKSRSKRTTKKVQRKTPVRKSTRKVTKRKITIRKSTKRVTKKPASKRRRIKPEYKLEPLVIKLPKTKKDSGRTKAIMLCPKCKSGNIRVVDYIGTKCVVCRDCKFDERNIYDVTYEERKAPKVKAVFKAGGHLRIKKRP